MHYLDSRSTTIFSTTFSDIYLRLTKMAINKSQKNVSFEKSGVALPFKKKNNDLLVI